MHEFTPTELARLADYFARELDPSEVADVEHWVNEHPARRQFVEELRQTRLDFGSATAIEAVYLRPRVEMLSKSLTDIYMREQAERTPAASHRKDRIDTHRTSGFSFQRSSRFVWVAIGATCASLLVLFAGWQLVGNRLQVPTSVSMSTYGTSKGERATITLPDGSTILLNVASRIQVPSNYATGNRTVYLNGEALFTVTHNTGTPFTVVSGPSTTRVLGTSFVVRHYETDTATTVAVRDGKVVVGTTVLTAGQETMVAGSGTPPRIQPTEARRFAFVDGAMIFEDVLLPEAIAELNRWYDADIRLGDAKLMSRRVIGIFESGSLTDLVSILELTFNVRVVREGRVLTLYPRG